MFPSELVSRIAIEDTLRTQMLQSQNRKPLLPRSFYSRELLKISCFGHITPLLSVCQMLLNTFRTSGWLFLATRWMMVWSSLSTVHSSAL